MFSPATSKAEMKTQKEKGGPWNLFEQASVLGGEDKTMGYERNAGEVAEVTIGNSFEVKDLRRHSPETIETLRELLASGTSVRPDLKRPDFYELEDDTCVFYIYVSPVNGSVELLATWPRIEGGEKQARCH
jgi:hypothetical protein